MNTDRMASLFLWVTLVGYFSGLQRGVLAVFCECIKRRMGWIFLAQLIAITGFLLPSANVLSATEKLEVNVTYLTRFEEPVIPLSLLDLPIEVNGRPGAQLGLSDNQTTGSFLGHLYTMDEVIVEAEADITERFRQLYEQGRRLFVLDLEPIDLLAVADIADDTLLFNVRSRADVLRDDECRANVLHFPPSRSMLADGLAQYLAWKRWNQLVLVTGRHEKDQLYAAALRRGAKRFGLKIREEKDWTAVPGARRTDSGHHSLQQEIPTFTRFKDHDVLLVADELDEFGEYMLFRSSDARLVAGTHGLHPTEWHRSQEQWGATQIQRRFHKLADRPMSPRDYAAWAAMRSLGEAVSNTSSNTVTDLRGFMLSDKFKLAGFKGVPLTFRHWNGQLRQPILIVGPRMLVSVSPQDGFLHERSELDTMGLDESDSNCENFQAD